MHSLGFISKDAVEKARSQVAHLISGKESEIYFTSCASEANNFAMKGVAEASRQKGNHIIISEIEHFSVLYAARRLGQQGFEITLLLLTVTAWLQPGDVEKAIKGNTILVSIQHANPEIGTIQPIERIARICRGKTSPFIPMPLAPQESYR